MRRVLGETGSGQVVMRHLRPGLPEQICFILPLLSLDKLRLLKDRILVLFSPPVKISPQLLISMVLPVRPPLHLLHDPAGEGCGIDSTL